LVGLDAAELETLRRAAEIIEGTLRRPDNHLTRGS